MPTLAKPKPAHQPTSWPSPPHRIAAPERTQIDAVVEKREAGVAARIGLRIELADEGGDVRLHEAHAHHDEREREIEDRGVERVAVLDGQFERTLVDDGRQRRVWRQVL